MPSKMKFFTGQGPREIIAHQIYCSDYHCSSETRPQSIPNGNGRIFSARNGHGNYSKYIKLSSLQLLE